MASEPLKALMAQARDRSLVLPDFQRDFVWKPSDVVKLLSSLFNNYPIGGLLFMENSGVYSFRPLDGVGLNDDDGADLAASIDQSSSDTTLILDGQQRLTSCYRAFYGTLDDKTYRYAGRYYFLYRTFMERFPSIDAIAGPTLEEYIIFEPARSVKRYLNTQADEIAVGKFPLDIIFHNPRGASYSEWLSQYSFNNASGNPTEYARLSSVQSTFISQFLEHITAYQIHYEKIKRDTKPDVICVVFETINTTGKRLTVFDLLVARCFRFGIKLRDKLEEAIESYEMIRRFDPTGEDLVCTVLPRIISLLDSGACRRSDMITLDPKRIDRIWEKAVSALNLALELMVTEYGCFGTRFVPFADMIPPMAGILASDRYRGDDTQRRRLKRWYWRTVFSQYMVSSTETKIARIYREWTADDGWLVSEQNIPESVREFVLRDSVLEDVARIDSGIYRGVITLLLSGSLKDIGDSSSPLKGCVWNEIEDHHIYPKKFLEANGVKGNACNTILNRTPILRATNGLIGSTAPHVYLTDKRIIGVELSRGILDAHAIPEVVFQEFSRDIYERFLEGRKVNLLIKIEEVVEAASLPDV